MVLSLVSALLVAAGCGGRQEALQRFEGRRVVMGTTARVVLYAKDEATARKAIDAAFERVEALDQVLSDYREDSEVRALARKGRGRYNVSLDLLAAFSMTTRFDALDPSIGPLVLLWREAAARGVRPSPEAIEAARRKIGRVEVDTASVRVGLPHYDMRFDFGAMGKGYAADEAMLRLDDFGISRALVDVGGDLSLGHPPPGEEGWAVALAEPGAVRRLSRCGVATSGDAERGFTIDGVHYSHAINPKTGRPMQDRRRVTVIAPSAMLADAWATTYRLHDRERAIAAPAPAGVHVRIEWWEDGVRHVETTPDFPVAD